MFYTKCDLVKALSTALGKGAKYAYSAKDCHETMPCEATGSTGISMETQIKNVATYLNDQVHEQAKQIISHYKNQPQKYKSFKLESYTALINPALLDFIKLLTQPVRSKRRRLFEKETDNHTKEMCQLFIQQMKWIIPWPGDWHILLNYQKAIIKAYADAGLVTLGEATQHRSETLTSLIQCTNFRRTHNFFIQAMEAFYRFFLSFYLRDREAIRTPSELTDQI